MPKKTPKINLVTHNKNKLAEFKHILEPDILVNHIDIEYDEIKADTNEEVAANSAKNISKKLKKIVVVEDSGLFITALNGFPGTCSAFVHRGIGLDGILKLMKGVKNRECIYRSAVAYCEPNKKPKVFLGEEKGIIAEKIRGNFGFGHDPVFIPEGHNTTYGEMEDYLSKKKFRETAILKLKEFFICATPQKKPKLFKPK